MSVFPLPRDRLPPLDGATLLLLLLAWDAAG
jgi:hypothetical protein